MDSLRLARTSAAGCVLFLPTWEHTSLGQDYDCRNRKTVPDLPTVGELSIVATLILGGKHDPGKTARAGGHINRRSGGNVRGTETRFARLEATTEHIQCDVTELKATTEQIQCNVARLEATTTHIQLDVTDLKIEFRGMRSEARADFRLLFGAILSVAVGLGGLMAKGFGWY